MPEVGAPLPVDRQQTAGQAPHTLICVADRDEIAWRAGAPLSAGSVGRDAGCWVSRGGPQQSHCSYLTHSSPVLGPAIGSPKLERGHRLTHEDTRWGIPTVQDRWLPGTMGFRVSSKTNVEKSQNRRPHARRSLQPGIGSEFTVLTSLSDGWLRCSWVAVALCSPRFTNHRPVQRPITHSGNKS
jgi:hypothetical protein